MSDENFNETLQKDVHVILLLVNNSAFNITKPTYMLDLYGKSLKDWVRLAVDGVKITEVQANKTDDIITLTKPYLEDSKYTFILYSDTPLLRRKTFLEIFEYMSVKGLSALKLTRGYVFETEHLKKVDKIYSPQTAYFDEEDFIAAYNLKQLALVSDIMKSRILDYHFKGGVRIIDPSTTYIDAEVNISPDVVIYPNNSIKGKSHIEKGVLLYPNNVIVNSYILEKATVTGSYIYDSIIGKNCGVGPFAYIQDQSVLESRAQVGAFVEIRKGLLKEGARVRRLSFVGKEDLD